MPSMHGCNPYYAGHFTLTGGVDILINGLITLTFMPKQSPPQTKRQALQASGTFNLRSTKVRHALFQRSEFFDPEDLLQLKYETLRALKAEGRSIAQAANEFGLSRPTIYQAQANFAEKGVEGSGLARCSYVLRPACSLTPFQEPFAPRASNISLLPCSPRLLPVGAKVTGWV